MSGWDCHAHVLDPTRPAAPGARYAPWPGAGPAEFAAHLDALGLDHGVLVTASAHGTDNEPLLAALGPGRCGVAVVEPEVPDDELDRLVAGGVVAVRVQDLYPGGVPLDALAELGPRLAARGGHVEIWTSLDRRPDLAELITGVGCPVVLDHLGFSDPDDRSVDAELVDLASSGLVWVCASGARRHLPDRSPAAAREALAPRVRALVEAVPQQVLWASDWPHVGMSAGPSTADLQADLALWFPDDDLRRQVLVTNPARCYEPDRDRRRG